MADRLRFPSPEADSISKMACFISEDIQYRTELHGNFEEEETNLPNNLNLKNIEELPLLSYSDDDGRCVPPKMPKKKPGL